jgi:hypothetical protein
MSGPPTLKCAVIEACSSRNAVDVNMSAPYRISPVSVHVYAFVCGPRDPIPEGFSYIFNMPREFFDPTPEEQVIVLVEQETIRNAEGLIKSCEQCNPEGAEWPVGCRT